MWIYRRYFIYLKSNYVTKYDERIIVKSIRSTGKTGMQKNKIKYAHAKKNDSKVGYGQVEKIR